MPDVNRRRRTVTLAAVFGLVLALVTACASGAGTPADDSADAGFARDMQVHHAQAVDMSMTVLRSTSNDDVRQLAYDIATTQQQQIGQMYAWLDLWGLSQTGSTLPMAWMHSIMNHDDHGGAVDATASGLPDMTMPTSMNDPMPGMATPDQMAALRAASGAEADRIFLELMITHHKAGVQMAKAAVQLGDQAVVVDLAAKMVAGQDNEIIVMDRLLSTL